MNAHFPSDPAGPGPGPGSGAPLRVLVTGASGAVGSLLAPRLLLAGHAVRAFGRDANRIEDALADQLLESELEEVEFVRGDVLSGEGLARALDGVDVAYYLMHSMERSAGEPAPFTERELLAAENFAAAAARSGVGRIVYLGGLVPRWAPTAGRRPGSRHLA